MIARTAAAAVLLVTGAAFGADDTGVLGSPLSGIDRTVYSCFTSTARTICKAGGGGMEHLGLPVLTVTREYRDELLRSMTVMFDEARFADVERRMSARLGAAESADERLRSGMAGVITNRVRIWRSGSAVIVLEQFAEKITRSALRYLTEADYAELMRRRDAARVRGARDL